MRIPQCELTFPDPHMPILVRRRPLITARRQALSLFLASAVLIVGGVAHALKGWSLAREMASVAGLADGQLSVLAVGWQLGSASLVAFGVIAIAVGVARWRRRPGTGTAIRIVAITLASFGIGALFLGDRRFVAFYFGYLIIGALLAVGVSPSPGVPAPDDIVAPEGPDRGRLSALRAEPIGASADGPNE